MAPLKSLLLAGAALVSLSACHSTEPVDTLSNEEIYQQRFATLMANGGIMRTYEPLELIEVTAPITPLPRKAPEDVGVTAEAIEQATDYAAASQADAFLVWKSGALIAEHYGNDESAASLLVSKSLSKPLSAIAVGRAIALGKIASLDQSVSDFIPEWKGTPKEEILVRHLLDMRSGLLAQGYSTDPDSPWNRAYIAPNHGDVLIHDYPMTDVPGTVYAYSNATAELVALLIERATGVRYPDFLETEVLGPIGAAGGDIWVSQEGGLAHSGCCMHLPAESWLKLGILLANDGMAGETRLLPENYVREMRTGTEANPNYGLGVWIGSPYSERRGFTGPNGPGPQVLHSAPYLAPDLFLFDGNSNQVVYISPANELVALRLGPTPPKSPEWDNATIPNLILSGLEPR